MKYADLTLYFGLCNSDGRGEGRFDPSASDDWSRRRYLQAMQNVQKYLMQGWEYGLTVVDDYLVPSESDAVVLINFAEKNIPNSHGLIELVDRMHGKVRFFRRIRFDGAVEHQRDHLIEEMKKSGYVPINHNLDYFGRVLAELHSQNKQMLIEEGLDADAPWRKALKFY